MFLPHRAARDQPLPFFLPPEAFIHTHLPFEPCWQLLPQPVRAEEWWARPALALGFAAAGGTLLDGGSLSACTVMQLDRCGFWAGERGGGLLARLWDYVCPAGDLLYMWAHHLHEIERST